MDLLNVENPEPEGDLLLRQTFEILGEMIDDTPQVYSPNAGSDVDLSDTTVTTRGYSRGSNHPGGGKKSKFSKNLISERKRRQKLNEKLYSLRAIVPKITKMDKASIMADAIDYVQELKAQVTKMGREISAIESTSSGASSSSSAVDDEYPACRTPEKPRTELQMEVEKLDEYRTCMVRFRCSGKELMEIVRALETLDMEVINATISTFQGQIFTNYMTKVRDERLMEKENLEGIVLDALKHTVC